MTGAFTLLSLSHTRARNTILYGMYFEPDFPAPNSTEDYNNNVLYLPYIAYPIEVVNQCRKK